MTIESRLSLIYQVELLYFRDATKAANSMKHLNLESLPTETDAEFFDSLLGLWEAGLAYPADYIPPTF